MNRTDACHPGGILQKLPKTEGRSGGPSGGSYFVFPVDIAFYCYYSIIKRVHIPCSYIHYSSA